MSRNDKSVWSACWLVLAKSQVTFTWEAMIEIWYVSHLMRKKRQNKNYKVNTIVSNLCYCTSRMFNCFCYSRWAVVWHFRSPYQQIWTWSNRVVRFHPSLYHLLLDILERTRQSTVANDDRRFNVELQVPNFIRWLCRSCYSDVLRKKFKVFCFVFLWSVSPQPAKSLNSNAGRVSFCWIGI